MIPPVRGMSTCVVHAADPGAPTQVTYLGKSGTLTLTQSSPPIATITDLVAVETLVMADGTPVEVGSNCTSFETVALPEP